MVVAAVLLWSFAALSPTDLGALEMYAVNKAISIHAQTQPGKLRCSKLPFANSVSEARSVYSAVFEAMQLEKGERPPLTHEIAFINHAAADLIHRVLGADGRTDGQRMQFRQGGRESQSKIAPHGKSQQASLAAFEIIDDELRCRHDLVRHGGVKQPLVEISGITVIPQRQSGHMKTGLM